MEVNILPQPSRVATKPLRYYSASLKHNSTFPEEKGLEFYYIGSRKRRVELLLSKFNAGFYSDNLGKACKNLSNLAAKQNCLPDVIFLEKGFSAEAFEEFGYFLQLNPEIAKVPIILDYEDSFTPDFSSFKNFSYIDDICDVEGIDQITLKRKIRFMKGVKRSNSKAKIEQQSTLKLNGFTPGFTFKRLFDITLASIGIVLISPVLLLIALAIKMESKGSVIYRSPRAGRGYKIFEFYKFRTMVADADKKVNDLKDKNQYGTTGEDAVFFKLSNDPRVTKVGAFLRNTSLDELPQLFNVLKGDMSIVGNRPLPLYEAAQLTTNQWSERFVAPAGITGLWQVKKRGKSEMSVEERLNLDITYAKNSTLRMDLWIMLQTPKVLIQEANV